MVKFCAVYGYSNQADGEIFFFFFLICQISPIWYKKIEGCQD